MRNKCLIRICVLVFSILSLVGCARSELTLSLDIYDKNPRDLAPLSVQRTQKILSDLNSLQVNANELQELQLSYSKAQLKLITVFITGTTGVIYKIAKRNPESITHSINRKTSEYEQLFNAHINELRLLHEESNNAIDKAKEKVMRYIAVRAMMNSKGNESRKNDSSSLEDEFSTLQSEILSQVEITSSLLVKISRPLNSDFENLFNMEEIKESVAAVEAYIVNNSESGTDNKDYKEILSVLRRELDEWWFELRNIRAKRTKEFEFVKSNIDLVHKTLSSNEAKLSESFREVANVMTNVPKSLSLDGQAVSSLADLIRSSDLLFSQLDRMQDPADPVWRIVSIPENDKYWNNKFTETHFKAEGNSEVVIVRDSPISYRVQRGENDPRALVKAQLQISRAIGDAALTVAGAKSWIGLPSAQKDDSGQISGISDPNFTDSDKFAESRAKANTKAQQINRLSRALRENLEIIKAALSAASNESQQKALIQDLKSSLEVQEKLFKMDVVKVK